MFKAKVHILILVASVFACAVVFAQQEQLTITTYYPSPYGVYNVLRLYPNSGGSCAVKDDVGKMWYNSTINEFVFCGANNTILSLGGNASGVYWAKSGNDIYNNNTGSVGISGVPSGVYALEVNGTSEFSAAMRFSGPTNTTYFSIKNDQGNMNVTMRDTSGNDSARFQVFNAGGARIDTKGTGSALQISRQDDSTAVWSFDLATDSGGNSTLVGTLAANDLNHTPVTTTWLEAKAVNPLPIPSNPIGSILNGTSTSSSRITEVNFPGKVTFSGGIASNLGQALILIKRMIFKATDKDLPVTYISQKISATDYYCVACASSSGNHGTYVRQPGYTDVGMWYVKGASASDANVDVVCFHIGVAQFDGDKRDW